MCAVSEHDHRSIDGGHFPSHGYGRAQVIPVRLNVNLDRTFRLDEISEAHRYMEGNRASGKVVVLTAAQ